MLLGNHPETSLAQPSAAQPTKPFLRVLRGQTVDPPPVWLMRQAGRYLPEYRALRAKAPDFLGLCYTPELAAEITLQPVRRFAMDAAILFSDILVVPHALGLGVEFREGEGPVVERLGPGSALARLEPGGVAARLGPVYEAVGRVRDALDGETALIGFAGAPWTVATYMVEGGTSRDFAAVKGWMYTRPDEFAALIDILVEATVHHLVAQARAGAEALQIFDSWAGVLPEEEFGRWCVEPVRRVVAGVKSEFPSLPIIGFPRQAGLSYRAFAERSGVDCVGLDTTVPVEWAARELQAGWAVQGNLDPVVLVVGGPAMVSEARRIKAALAGGPFIFNLGHGVLPKTPPEHVAELVSVVRAGPGGG